MNGPLEKVLRHLAGSDNIEAVSINDLEQLADESPYFPVAQFLLAKKLKTENNSNFTVQAQKAALYFSNPYWLHYQLTRDRQPEIVFEEFTVVDETNKNSRNTDIENSAEIVGVSTSLTQERLSVKQRPKGLLLKEADEDKHFEMPSPEVAPREKLATTDKENLTQAEEEMASIAREANATTGEFLSEVGTKDETFTRDTIEKVILETQLPATLETTEVMEEMAGASRETDEKTASFLEEAQKSGESPEQLSTQTAIPPFVPGNAPKNIKDETAEPDEHERMFQNIKAMLDATSEEADADVKDAVIPIDPYYTIDYFASQGIKLELDQNPNDQLGRNLKKFTQWLKHMKKLGPEDATEVIARTETEADIPKIAESSNTVREVVTEAMASVLEKQGKNDKAIELYKKLSFLNPDKSAYFASKIKNLKGI